MITHVVCFKFIEPSPQLLAETRDLLLTMPGRVPTLKSIEVGLDLLHSERSYDLVLIARFDSWEDLDAYQVHPYHDGTVRAHMRRITERSVAVDYES